MKMLWWQRKPAREEDVVLVLRRAFAKAVVAERMLIDRRMRARLILTTAVAGFPVPSELLSGVYSAGALSDIKKAIKLLNKMIDESADADRVRLQSVQEILKSAHKDMHPSELKEIISKALATLQGL